ncbi:hypothetical protein Leryth_024381 [Lithospermum erythrorhizon]|nr:hypothetical protein Leryth_024381 [Lithospermum erythrorhizon]
MGNCFRKQSKLLNSEITPSELMMMKSFPVVKLHGPENNILTCYMRFALHYKPVTLQFVPSDAFESPVLHLQDDIVTGNVETMLHFLDMKFPQPRLSRGVSGWFDQTTPLVVWVVLLQHRSMLWHLERMVRWGGDLVERGGQARGDPVMGSPRMEVKKFGRSYSQMLEVMLEHAQMEEKVVFPILERADRGLCKAANDEHARDLPMMNGIKEDIKSVGVLDSGTAVFQEALSSLVNRLKKLQVHCKEHFHKEERELLSLMEATELCKDEQDRVLGQCLEVMPGTHTNQFRFFMEGLLPHDAIHYLDMITQSSDKNRIISMLRMLVE